MRDAHLRDCPAERNQRLDLRAHISLPRVADIEVDGSERGAWRVRDVIRPRIRCIGLLFVKLIAIVDPQVPEPFGALDRLGAVHRRAAPEGVVRQA